MCSQQLYCVARTYECLCVCIPHIHRLCAGGSCTIPILCLFCILFWNCGWCRQLSMKEKPTTTTTTTTDRTLDFFFILCFCSALCHERPNRNGDIYNIQIPCPKPLRIPHSNALFFFFIMFSRLPNVCCDFYVHHIYMFFFSSSVGLVWFLLVWLGSCREKRRIKIFPHPTNWIPETNLMYIACTSALIFRQVLTTLMPRLHTSWPLNRSKPETHTKIIIIKKK